MTKFELDDFMNLLEQLRKETNDFKDLSTKDSKILALESTVVTLRRECDTLGRRLVKARDTITDLSVEFNIIPPNTEMSDSVDWGMKLVGKFQYLKEENEFLKNKITRIVDALYPATGLDM